MSSEFNWSLTLRYLIFCVFQEGNSQTEKRKQNKSLPKSVLTNIEGEVMQEHAHLSYDASGLSVFGGLGQGCREKPGKWLNE